MPSYRTLDFSAPNNPERLQLERQRIKEQISKMKGRAHLADENGYISPEKIIYYSQTHQGESIEIINTFGNISAKDVENEKLRKLLSEKDKAIAKLKEDNESKAASWSYIKAGTIIILIGTFLGLANNPNMFISASKKLASTSKYIKDIRASKNNINIFARGLSYFYKRLMKFVDDNQLFSMCFASGVFLIGVGIWKRYF